MPWTYEQRTGRLIDPSGAKLVEGYSGFGDGKNNPDMESIKDVGPIPVGRYNIEKPPFDSVTHGPFVMRFDQESEDDDFGRAGFLIHGDSMEHPGQASHGCIVVPRWSREDIARSEDCELIVVRG